MDGTPDTSGSPERTLIRDLAPEQATRLLLRELEVAIRNMYNAYQINGAERDWVQQKVRQMQVDLDEVTRVMLHGTNPAVAQASQNDQYKAVMDLLQPDLVTPGPAWVGVWSGVPRVKPTVY